MGGQQFAEDAVLVDMTGMNRVLAFDRGRGVVEVDAGICWPELVAWLAGAQEGEWPQWGIRQKQTGADRLSLGGALAANAHGRGLAYKPFIDDIESFHLVDASGELVAAGGGADSDFAVWVWSVLTGRLLDALSGHEGPVADVSFHPSAPVLASASSITTELPCMR